jgi:hypothetical protein
MQTVCTVWYHTDVYLLYSKSCHMIDFIYCNYHCELVLSILITELHLTAFSTNTSKQKQYNITNFDVKNIQLNKINILLLLNILYFGFFHNSGTSKNCVGQCQHIKKHSIWGSAWFSVRRCLPCSCVTTADMRFYQMEFVGVRETRWCGVIRQNYEL